MTRMSRGLPGPCKVCQVDPQLLKNFPDIKRLPWELLINYAITGTVGEANIIPDFRWKKTKPRKQPQIKSALSSK